LGLSCDTELAERHREYNEKDEEWRALQAERKRLMDESRKKLEEIKDKYREIDSLFELIGYLLYENPSGLDPNKPGEAKDNMSRLKANLEKSRPLS
jgi:predicted nuclease with TOPRIM domain